MKVLGIETSCDETGVALFDDERGLLGEALFSQVATHAEFGGVVPELASRDHIRKLTPLVRRVLEQADTPATALDGVAYTAGPGLVGALLVGASLARSLAWGLGIPVLGVHHMEGHLMAPHLEARGPDYPFLALLVSGGHTLLVEVEGLGRYRVLGQSLDDAVGEAFDKTAKLMGLPYPGGPFLAQLAEQGNPEAIDFPRPMTDRPGLDFSFSGLKTYVLQRVYDEDADNQRRADIAAGFQEAVVDTLTIKCRRAVRQSGVRRLVVAGGVGANQRLRQRLDAWAAEEGVEVYFPRPALCTDNGAMIAYVGCLRLMAGERQQDREPPVRARWSLDSLGPPAATAQARTG